MNSTIVTTIKCKGSCLLANKLKNYLFISSGSS